MTVTGPDDGRIARLMTALGLMAICAFHLAGVFTVLISPEHVWYSDPVLTYDYSLHFQQINATTAFLGDARWHGYDPYFMGGYLKANLFNVDSKGWALFVFALESLLGRGCAFNLFIPVSLLIIPLMGYAACRVTGFARAASLTGALFYVSVFWSAEPLTMVHWGLLSFVIASSAAVPVGLSILCFDPDKHRFRWIWTGLGTAGAFLIHALTPLLLLPGVIGLLWMPVIRNRKFWIFILGVLALVIAVNLGWLAPFIRNLDQLTSSAHIFTLQNTDPRFLVKYFSSPEHVWLVAAYVMGVAGVLVLMTERNIGRAAALAAGPLLFLGLAGFGSFAQVTARLQPVRFMVAAHWAVLPIAGYGIKWIFTFAGNASRRNLSVFLAVLLLLPAIPSIFTTHPDVPPGGRLLSSTMPPVLKQLENWIRSRTDDSARILMEDSGTLSGHRYFGIYYPGLVPLRTGRQLIGGPWPYMFIKSHIVDYHEGVLLGRPIERYLPEEFEAIANAYNLGWVICWSDRSRLFFDDLPSGIVREEVLGDFVTYRLARSHSYILNGSGKVRADFNRLAVDQAQSEDGEYLLSYHYVPGLKALPMGFIKPELLPGLPLPFIRVRGTGSRFGIEYF
ncbi:hypothetical protein JXA40_12230 [bacterium]|nr:hypothetical protein [candidate division CSSED10-310 bacterium]